MYRSWFLAILFVVSIFSVAIAASARFTHSTGSVTASSTTQLAANSARTFFFAINISDTDMYCKFNAAAVLNEGIFLVKNGGYLLLDVQVSREVFNCIHGGVGSKTILLTEGRQ